MYGITVQMNYTMPDLWIKHRRYLIIALLYVQTWFEIKFEFEGQNLIPKSILNHKLIFVHSEYEQICHNIWHILYKYLWKVVGREKIINVQRQSRPTQKENLSVNLIKLEYPSVEQWSLINIIDIVISLRLCMVMV